MHQKLYGHSENLDAKPIKKGNTNNGANKKSGKENDVKTVAKIITGDKKAKSDCVDTLTVEEKSDFNKVKSVIIDIFGDATFTSKAKSLVIKDLKEFDADTIINKINELKDVAKTYFYVSTALRIKEKTVNKNNKNSKPKTPFHAIASADDFNEDLENLFKINRNNQFGWDDDDDFIFKNMK